MLGEEYTGENTKDKLERVVRQVESIDKEIDSYLVSRLDDIGWLLNLRGNYIECNPFF